jgi:hypothetical protein
MFYLGFICGLFIESLALIILIFYEDITDYFREQFSKIGVYQYYCYLRLKYGYKEKRSINTFKNLFDGGYITENQYKKLIKRHKLNAQ